MTRTLVLGGAGFIGTAACKELMRRGVETIAAGRKDRPYGTFTSYVAFDRDDEAQLKRALESVQPDVVLDLAGDEPKQVEAMIRSFNGNRYVFVSSGIVYPDVDERPAGEDDFVPLDGQPPAEVDYMAGKRWCETVLSRSSDFPWTVVRPPAVFGAADRTLRIAAYIQRVEDGGPVLVPQETYKRQAGLAWVKDVGYACALACDPRKQTNHRAYNVGFEEVSLRAVIEGIARAMAKPANFHPVPFKDLPDGASPYGPNPKRPAGYAIDQARSERVLQRRRLEAELASRLVDRVTRRQDELAFAS